MNKLPIFILITLYQNKTYQKFEEIWANLREFQRIWEFFFWRSDIFWLANKLLREIHRWSWQKKSALRIFWSVLIAKWQPAIGELNILFYSLEHKIQMMRLPFLLLSLYYMLVKMFLGKMLQINMLPMRVQYPTCM